MASAVIHPGAIGDLVLALPLVQTLAEQGGPVELVAAGDRAVALAARGAVQSGRCLDDLPLAPLFAPDAEIPRRLADWLTRFGAIVSAYPDETFTANLRRAFAGEVMPLDVRPTTIEASGLHASDVIYRQLLDGPTPMPRIDRQRNFEDEKPTLLIHPGSGGRAKCWPIESFIEVARALPPGRQAVFVLGPAERERMSPADLDRLAEEFALVEPASIDELLFNISVADAYLGNDSGPTHLAAAMGVPTAALFGPTDPRVWGPRGECVRVVRGDASLGGDWGISAVQMADAIAALRTA